MKSLFLASLRLFTSALMSVSHYLCSGLGREDTCRRYTSPPREERFTEKLLGRIKDNTQDRVIIDDIQVPNLAKLVSSSP
jgi:hypothetical protein